MDKLKPRVVIFDLGSTLIEYETIPWDELGILCIDSAFDYLEGEGLALPDRVKFHATYNNIRDEYRQVAGKSMIEWDVPTVASRLLSELKLISNIKTEHDLPEKFFDAYYKPVDDKLYAYADTVPTLKRLRESFPVLGLISNTIFPERAHLAELERFGIAPFLDFKVFSSTFRLRKPHPDIFCHAANLAGFAPSECVYVGDRYLEDIQGPGNIGMPAILKIKEGRQYPDEMPEAIRRIDNLSELEKHLEL